MGNFFKKYGPTLLSLGGAVLTAVSPTLRHLIAGNPTWTAILGAIGTITAHLMTPPHQVGK